MKVVFTGTSEFAVPSLEALVASHHELAAVVTQPDRPRGRGRGMQMSPVKEVALAHSIPILQPERIRDADAISQIQSYGPVGAMVVVAYGQKIPTSLLDWPRYGAVNVHGSILPKYRGAAPIQYALIMGEQQTGVTTMLMDEGWDTGSILLQEAVHIYENENAGELSERLARLGADLLIRTLEGLETGSINPIPQDDELASLARALPRDAGAIDWTDAATDIVNRIRGCTPRPGAFTKIHGVQVKVWAARVKDPSRKLGEPGQVLEITADRIVVAAGSGSVELLELQPESRRRMSAADFARGGKLSMGDRFDTRIELAE